MHTDGENFSLHLESDRRVVSEHNVINPFGQSNNDYGDRLMEVIINDGTLRDDRRDTFIYRCGMIFCCCCRPNYFNDRRDGNDHDW